MKRLFSLLMVLMLAAALSLPVWADDNNNSDSDSGNNNNNSTVVTSTEGVYVTGYTVTTPAGGEITTLNVGDKVNISGFMVEVGAEGRSKLVRTQLFFQRCSCQRVLFYHHLDGPDGDALVLQG